MSTFAGIVTDVMKRLNYSSAEARERVENAVNDRYKQATSSVGLNITRRATAQTNVTIGVSTVTFTGIEKVITVTDKTVTPYIILTEVTLDELRALEPFSSSSPKKFAVQSMGASTVTILLDCIPQTAFTLYTDGYAQSTTLAGTQIPAFSEDFHDILFSGACADEYRKMEKLKLAEDSESMYAQRLSDLRMFIAKSSLKDIWQGKTSSTQLGTRASGSGGSGAGNGALSYTQSGLITFDRTSASPGLRYPFAIAVGSDPIPGFTVVESQIILSDNTTDNVNSTQHGLVPKAPGDSTKFLNGASTPDYAQVKDSDLSTSDVATNNVSSVKHGLAPKSPADTTKFLNGAAAPDYVAVKDSDLSTSDIVTNDVSISKHGFVPRAPNDTTKFLRGDATWAVGASPTIVTSTSTGTQADFAPGISTNSGSSTIVRLNNASLLTITGLASGIDGQRVVFVSIGAGQVDFAHQNVGSSATNRFINFATSASTSLAAGVGTAEYEYDGTTQRWRLIKHAQGSWITPTFNAANFSGTGGSWSVDSGDILSLSYCLDGRTITVEWYISSTSVVVCSSLNILNGAWGGFTTAKTTLNICLYNNAGSGNTVGFVQSSAASGAISIFALGGGNFTTVTNGTAVFGEITFEVQ